VVVIGAGFAGVHAAKGLRHAPCDVVVVDRNNYHLFQPLLYQVATGLLDPSEIAHPVRAILRNSPNAEFRLAEIRSVEPDQRRLITVDGATIAYDVLVVATGSVDNHFGLPGVADHAAGLKDLPSALELRTQVLRAFERAATTDDARLQETLMSIAIIGGGPSGVETAGALAELIDHVLARDFPELDVRSARITLLEAGDQLLPAFHRRLGAAATIALRAKGVDVRLERAVESIRGDLLSLDDGSEVKAATIVWTAGVRPNAPQGLSDQPGRLPVDGHLRLAGRDDVYVLGDAAECRAGGVPLPMLAPVAIQQGDHVAREIRARLEATPSPPPFRYHDRGTMATIGRNSAVAEIGPLRFSGFFGWLMWLFVHLMYLVSFRSRAVVLINWGWNYLFYDRPVRLITTAGRSTGAELSAPTTAQEHHHANPPAR